MKAIADQFAETPGDRQTFACAPREWLRFAAHPIKAAVRRYVAAEGVSSNSESMRD